jgi:superfamily II RNA helicase
LNRKFRPAHTSAQSSSRKREAPRRQRRFEEDSDEEDDLAGIPKKQIDQFMRAAVATTQQKLKAWHDESLMVASAPPSGPKDVRSALDPWQMQAFEALKGGQNVVVDAPTTAGKTRAVEAYFTQNIDNPDFRAAYTTPVKSLSNDKLREFRAMFGRERVGIATGDIKDNLNAPIVVTTLETYRNSLLGVEPDLNRTLVVFDEYHFMQDDSRGSAWEEAIILTPDSCQLLLMSASVDNGEEFVTWLEKIHQRKTLFIQTKHRPVPLTNILYFQNAWILADELPPKALAQKARGELLPISSRQLAHRLVSLIDAGLTPCIVYAGRRKSTEVIIQDLSKVLKPLPENEREAIGRVLMEEQADTKALSFLDPKLRSLMQTYGIAYHHSGMAPAARIAVEAVLKRGLLRFCSATMGLSIGINFSVKSSLISDYQRPGERGMSRYSPSEVLQMLGRAGRRGRDVIGYSLWPHLDSYRALAKAKRDRCDSRLKNDPTTFLSLVGQGRDGKDIETFYARSFMRFGDSGVDLGLIRKQRIESKLGKRPLPCLSPAYEFVSFHRDGNGMCVTCPLKKDCHRYIEAKINSDLAALQLHLHQIGALDSSDHLSNYGATAKYFPQSGGLVLARMIADGQITEKNLGAAAELMACLSIARFKTPQCDARYRLPFKPEDIEKQLEEFYPRVLFPELYDEPFGRRTAYVIREFNPDAGYPIKCWLQGMPWKELVRVITSEKFAQGDLISLIYRVASYLQSLAQAQHPTLSRSASDLREMILREPLSINL